MKKQQIIKKLIKYPHLLGHYFGYTLLTELHSKWIKDAFLSSGGYCLQAHRGSFKTTALCVVGVIWWMFFHFEDRILILRKDFTAASDVLQVISRILNSERCHELFVYIYGFDYEIVLDNNYKITWNLKTKETKEGNINAFGLGQDMTGSHFDKALVDDFVTVKDRISKAEREKTKLFIQDLRANILDPGKYAIFTGTPWHKLDAWIDLPTPVKYDVYSTGIKRFTPEYIKYLRTITSHSLFAANYELKHIASEDALFPDPVYCKWDNSLEPVGHIDAKYSGSHTGAFTLMAKRPDGKIQATGFLFTRHIVDDYTRLFSIWQRFRCGTVHMEENADKGYAARDLSDMGMLTRTYNERENKFVKIIQNLKSNWHLIEWSEDTDPLFIAQIMDFQEGMEPDDCADSAASLLREARLIYTGAGELQASEYEETYRE